MDSNHKKFRNQKGPFNMGWVVVMFDLPVQTKLEQKRATQFRKALLDDGYSMMQYSIYMRFCASSDRIRKHTARLEDKVPVGGNVQIVFITDKQWEKSISVIGKQYEKDKKLLKVKQPNLFEEW